MCHSIILLYTLSEYELIANNPAIAVCESETDALTDPKDVLHSTETTDGVLQSEKTSLLFLHPGGATPTNAHPETEGI